MTEIARDALLEGKVEFTRDRVQKEQRLAPRGVNFCPFHLGDVSAVNGKENAKIT